MLYMHGRTSLLYTTAPIIMFIKVKSPDINTMFLHAQAGHFPASYIYNLYHMYNLYAVEMWEAYI